MRTALLTLVLLGMGLYGENEMVEYSLEKVWDSEIDLAVIFPSNGYLHDVTVVEIPLDLPYFQYLEIEIEGLVKNSSRENAHYQLLVGAELDLERKEGVISTIMHEGKDLLTLYVPYHQSFVFNNYPAGKYTVRIFAAGGPEKGYNYKDFPSPYITFSHVKVKVKQ